jgi:hypothetical protein
MFKKELDLYHLRLERSSKSKRKEIRVKKAKGDKKETQEVWQKDKNRPDHLRLRKNKYFNDIFEYLHEYFPQQEKILKEVQSYSEAKARKELAAYEGISPEKRKENFNKFEFFKRRFEEKEQTKDEAERIYKTMGIFRWFFLLDKIYPEDINYFFSVNGEGKTMIDKAISEVRRKPGQKRR